MKKFLSVILAAIMAFSVMPVTGIVASAANLSESESNNNYNTADTFSLNTTMTGKMNVNSDIDMYKISTSKNGKLSLTFKHNYIDSYIEWTVAVYLYKSGQYTELSSTEISGNGDDIVELPDIGVVSGGTYYVKVFSSYYSYGELIGEEYKLSNTFTATEYYEKEANNDYNTATNIAIGNTYTGNLNIQGDIDMYKISASKNGKLSLTFKHNYIDSYIEWSVVVYLYKNGQYTELSSTEISGNGNDVVELPDIGVVSGGTYYIKVFSSYYSYEELVGAEYKLSNSFTASEYYEKEPNNDYNAATNIVIGNTYSGNLNIQGDIDMYKISTPSTGKLSLTFKHDYIDSYIEWTVVVYLYKNGQYTELSSTDISGNGNSEVKLQNISTVSGGTYYIKVFSLYYSYEELIGEEYNIFTDFSPNYSVSSPSGFNIIGSGNSGKLLVLDWNGMANVNYYKVYVVSGGKEYLKGTTEDSQFKFTDLTAGWNYTVKVVAYYSYGGTKSATTTICAAPSPIWGSEVDAKASGNKLIASWEKRTCTGYVVQWSTDKSFSKIAGTKYITGAWNTSCSVNVSNPQNYYVRVRAYKTYNGMTAYGDFSPAVKPILVPGTITGFDIIGTGNKGKLLYLDWNGMAHTDGYRVYITSNGKDYYKGSTKDSQFKFTDLTPGWNYTVKVVAYNDNGTTTTTTTICAAPVTMTVNDFYAKASGNKLNISWDKQTCTGYVVQWSMDKSFSKIAGTKYISGAWNTSYSVSASNPQNYYVRVRAYKTYNGMTAYGDFSPAEKAKNNGFRHCQNPLNIKTPQCRNRQKMLMPSLTPAQAGVYFLCA